MEPVLGIGLPVYNGERYLGHALDCLRAQTFADFEVVVCDNASTDRTADIARAAAAADPRFRYVRNEHNIGAPGNFRRVFTLTRGEFFAWVAADDSYDPRYFATCVELLRRRPDAIGAFTAVRAIDPAGSPGDVIEEPIAWEHPDPAVRFGDLASFRHACLSAFAVWRRPVMAQVRVHLPFWGSDRLLLAELALRGPLALDERPLFFNRQHPERTSLQGSRTGNAAYFGGAATSRMLTWHYARQLWRAVGLADLDRAGRRGAQRALLAWAVQNRVKFARSAARGLVEFGREITHRTAARA
jgi:glycosyltransferase involved in cell wall biosynthesis